MVMKAGGPTTVTSAVADEVGERAAVYLGADGGDARGDAFAVQDGRGDALGLRSRGRGWCRC